ncbi:hypothetical protein [Bacillus sp. Hm123]|uniref:hypothetical protein n=1 Tax=Bacillus sp. Hm123 TaxID=3450745 RepID=UPI003F4313DA
MAGKVRFLTVSDLEYIAKYAECDGIGPVALQLEANPSSILNAIKNMRRDGTFDYFRNLNLFW